ncbi:MAG: beta-galactosidase [Prevotella sp.]|nr:beta-galactosidase [Prevotella sp.]
MEIDFSKGNLPYNSTVPGEIPIIASNPFPWETLPTVEEMEQLSECGFNTLGWWPMNYYDDKRSEESKMREYIRLCKYYRLRVLVSSENFNRLPKMVDGEGNLIVNTNPTPEEMEDNLEKCRKFVNKFKESGCIGGWDLKDETSMKYFKILKYYVDCIHELDPDRLISYNSLQLSPKRDPSTGEIENEKHAQEFIQAEQDYLRPGVWRYDSYPLYYNKEGNPYFKNKNFFYNLETFCYIAKKSKRPFWAYCMGMAHMSLGVDGNTKYYTAMPAPTESSLRFEAFNALAYGAQGIVYWSYIRENNSATRTNFSALMDAEGNRSPAWYAAHKINSEIKRYTRVFLGCDVLSVRAVEGGRIVGNDYRITFTPIDSINMMHGDLTLSHIPNGVREYFVIVSRNPLQQSSIQFWIDTKYKVLELTPRPIGLSGKVQDKAEEEEKSKEAGAKKVKSGDIIVGPMLKRIKGWTLNPGDYVILEWVKVE